MPSCFSTVIKKRLTLYVAAVCPVPLAQMRTYTKTLLPVIHPMKTVAQYVQSSGGGLRNNLMVKTVFFTYEMFILEAEKIVKSLCQELLCV